MEDNRGGRRNEQGKTSFFDADWIPKKEKRREAELGRGDPEHDSDLTQL